MSLGVGAGGYLVYLWQTGTLNPSRPLVSLTVILMVAGLQIVLFGFLGSQIVQVRRELFRTQKTVKVALNSIRQSEQMVQTPTTRYTSETVTARTHEVVGS